MLSAAVVAVGAIAAPDENSIKDEMSTGGPNNQSVDAYCDLRSLELEKRGKALVVSAGLRQFDKKYVYVFLYINTKGAAKSKPEFFVYQDEPLEDRNVAAAGVYEPGSAGRPKAQTTYTYKGRDVIFKVPLGVLGASKTIGVQAGSCGRGGSAQGDIAPGKYFYGDEEFDPATDHRYLPVDGTDRVIEGQVVVSCSGERSCQLLPLKGVKVAADGPKTYRQTTDTDGNFAFVVKKGVYKVTADAGGVRIKDKSKRVELLKPGTKTANFDACGFKGSSGTATASVSSGFWEGRDRACRNYIGAKWAESRNQLLVTWKSIGVCQTPGTQAQYGEPTYHFTEVPVKSGAPGHRLVATKSKIEFWLPYRDPNVGYGAGGTLNADGTGSGRASLYESIGNCTYGTTDGVPLRRK